MGLRRGFSEISKLAYQKFYFRLSYLLKALKRIDSWSELKRRAKVLMFLVKTRVLGHKGV